jgi:hypothetical protein
VQICERHKNGLRHALSLLKAYNQEAQFQAESLILMNAVENFPDLVASPPSVCPMCVRLNPKQEAEWTANCARSILRERGQVQ